MEIEKMTSIHYKECPECDTQIDIQDDAQRGQIIVCPHCQTPLEITQVNPLKFDWAFLNYGVDPSSEARKIPDSKRRKK